MTTLDKNIRGKAAQHLFEIGVIEAFSFSKRNVLPQQLINYRIVMMESRPMSMED